MSSWLLFLNNSNNDIFATDGDLYACTQSAWVSISKFIILLIEECWGSKPLLNEYSGVLKGYVCLEEHRFVWFAHNHSAGPSDVEQKEFPDGCVLADKNILFWFYLPREHRQCTHQYVDLKRLLTGRVPFKVTTEGEVQTNASSTNSMLKTNSELFLVTQDSKDLLFYCIQSLHISARNTVTTYGLNGIQNSKIAEFPHHTFRSISFPEACNIPADRAEGSYDAIREITVAHTDECEDVTCTLLKIKDELDDDCNPNFKQEMQQNPDEQQLQQPQEGPRHDNFPSVEARTRKTPSTKGKSNMNYRKMLCITKTYGQLAAAKRYAERKLWAGVSSRIGPTLLLQCPGCGKFFPSSNPKSLWNMLTHMKSQHMKYHAKLLSLVSNEIDILIPYMQKKIAVWHKRN